MVELFEKYAVAKSKRVEVFGKRLDAILAELDTRDLADVPTPVLLTLALKYGESLKTEYQPLSLRGEDIPFDFSSSGNVPNTWPV